jgi:hypothetical protein
MPGEGLLGEVVGNLIMAVVHGGRSLFGSGSERRARARAARKARADERASREQQQKWFEAVARQKARGEAGFASEAEARVALRGKGGRPSALDDRWF